MDHVLSLVMPFIPFSWCWDGHSPHLEGSSLVMPVNQRLNLAISRKCCIPFSWCWDGHSPEMRDQHGFSSSKYWNVDQAKLWSSAFKVGIKPSGSESCTPSKTSWQVTQSWRIITMEGKNREGSTTVFFVSPDMYTTLHTYIIILHKKVVWRLLPREATRQWSGFIISLKLPGFIVFDCVPHESRDENGGKLGYYLHF